MKKKKIKKIPSSFNIRRIQNLTANPLKIKPAVNQVELNYWNPQPELLKVSIIIKPLIFNNPFVLFVAAGEQWSKENGILLEAYSPLGSAEKVKKTLEIPVVRPNFSPSIWRFKLIFLMSCYIRSNLWQKS